MNRLIFVTIYFTVAILLFLLIKNIKENKDE